MLPCLLSPGRCRSKTACRDVCGNIRPAHGPKTSLGESQLRLGREAWILVALLLFFVVFTAYYTQRGIQDEEKGRPSSYSVGPNGLAAIHRVFRAQGLSTQQYRGDFTHLPASAGLLIMAEPMARGITAEEGEALVKWVE